MASTKADRARGSFPIGIVEPAFIEALEPRCLLAAAPVAEIGYDLDSRNASAFPNTGNKIVVAGSRAFFVPNLSPDLSTGGKELAVSDGTASGTHVVRDFTPGNVGTSISTIVPVGQNALFTASISGATQLYLTDGTDAGTIRLTDPSLLGLASGTLAYALSSGSQVYFNGTNSSGTSVLVRSNGTVAGTQIVCAAPTPSYLDNPMVMVGGRIYYAANFPGSGVELCSVDLATGTATMVKEIVAGTGTPAISGLRAIGNRLMFFATTPASGRELWTSNGASDGTAMVRELGNGAAGIDTLAVATANGSYLFIRNKDLWRSDGTSDGTVLVKTLNLSSVPTFANFQSGTQRGFIWFPNYKTLISTDGTAAGTIDIAAPTGASVAVTYFGSVAFGDGGAFFDVQTAPPLKYQLWHTDGTVAGTHPVSNFQATETAFLTATNTDASIAFFGNNGNANIGNELWTATSAPNSAHFVKDVNQTGLSSVPRYVTAAGGRLFYVRDVDDNGGSLRLWATDTATGASTQLESWVGTATGQPIVPFGDKVIVALPDVNGNGTEPLVTNGKVSGTVILGDLYPGNNSSAPSDFVEVGGRMFFTATVGAGSRPLFRTDGTKLGTERVFDTPLGKFVPLGEKLYFLGTGGSIWRIGPTGAAEQVVAGGDPVAYMGKSQGRLMIFRTLANKDLQFQIYDGVNAPQNIKVLPYVANKSVSSAVQVGTTTLFNYGQIWRTDFAAAGTVPIAGTPGVSGTPRVVNDVMYFYASTGGLARSDGTSQGTYPLSTALISLDELTVFDGKVFYTGLDPAQKNRRVLWSTDGTVNGTRPVLTGSGGVLDNPRWLVTTSNALYFSADDLEKFGSELWKVNATVRPTITAGAFEFETDQQIALTFSKDVTGPAVQTLKLVRLNDSSNIAIQPGWFSYSAVSRGLTITPSPRLADGNYRLTVPANAFSDVDGNVLAADFVLDFFVMAGDANRDQSVNGADYVILNANLGQSSRTWSQGDFDYDGVVGAADRDILYSQYGKTLMSGLGTVRGTVFNDVNADGTFNAGEAGLSGWSVFLDIDANQILDAGEPARTTDATGQYAFTLAPGGYKILQVLPSGWRKTAPTNLIFHTVSLDAGTSISGKDYGNAIIPAPTMAIASVSLINANTDQAVGNLSAGQTINLATFPISLRANATGSGIGSVRFVDNNNVVRIENTAPYSIAGENGTDTLAWNASVGSHALAVTPYSGTNASGTAGTPFSVNFTVVNQPPASTTAVTDLLLINANSDQSVGSLTNGQSINLANFPISVRAITSGTIGSVRFFDNGVLVRNENLAPYSIAGDSGPDYSPWNVATGNHVLTVTPYSGQDGSGAAGTTRTINFTVTNSVVPPPPAPLRINAGGPQYTATDGQTYATESGFSGGTTSQTAFAVANTNDDPLYYDRRFGANFTFSKAVANGKYTLYLNFAESYYTGVGQRRFDVFAEGNQILNDLDLVASAGSKTAYTRSFSVNVIDGKIDLSFVGVVGEAIVSSIALLPA